MVYSALWTYSLLYSFIQFSFICILVTYFESEITGGDSFNIYTNLFGVDTKISETAKKKYSWLELPYLK